MVTLYGQYLLKGDNKLNLLIENKGHGYAMETSRRYVVSTHILHVIYTTPCVIETSAQSSGCKWDQP